MREGWTYKNFREVCDVLYGFAFDSANFCDDDSFPQLVRIRDVVRGFSETYYNGNIPEGYFVERGDFLIGMDGEFNIAPWKSERALLNQRVCKVTTKNDALNRFVYYNLRIILKQIEDETPFVTVKHLSAKRLNAINLYLPPLSVQQSIVSELDMLSDLIAKHEEQVKAYDELAQSIFFDMFGDPVENEKGWEVKKIENVCSSIVRGPFGSALKKEFFVSKSPDAYKVYEQKNAIQKKATIGEYYISKEKYNELKRFEVFPKDIIMSCSGTIGEFYVIPDYAEKGVMNQALLKFTLNTSIDTLFFLYAMQFVKDNMTTHGTGLQNIGSVISIKNFVIGLPPLSLQTLFAEKIEAIERQKERIRQSMAEVKTLFDSRMDYYFN